GGRYAHGIGGFGDLGESAALASSHNGGRRVASSAHEIRSIAHLGGPTRVGSSHRVHRCRWGVFQGRPAGGPAFGSLLRISELDEPRHHGPKTRTGNTSRRASGKPRRFGPCGEQ